MPLRSLRSSLTLALALGLAPAFALGQGPAQLLAFRPVVQGGPVEYDIPADPAAVAACKVEISRQPSGFVLRDGQGKILRRFIDTTGNKRLNQYSYYQDGFEVYREVDLDGKPDPENKPTIDEARWMNGGGTRIAAVVNNKVQEWKRISAEESSKVLVQALATGNMGLLNTVIAGPDELTTLGIPGAEVQRLKAAEASRREAVSKLMGGLVGWDKKTVWLRFDAAMPHAIPADTSPDLKGDILLYENAVIFAGPPGGADANKTAFLQASELVKIGDAWKFVDLPRAINPAVNVPVVAMEGGIRSAIFRDAGAPAQDPAQEAATKALAQYDNENAEKLNQADKRKHAEYYVGRIPFLRALVKISTRPEDVLDSNKQIVDCLANAYQTGHYSAGLKLLINEMEPMGGKIASYAASRRINAEFGLENESPNANLVAIQKKWMNDMREFLAKYKDSDEAPDVLFQLAGNSEFNAEEKEAREYYEQLAKQYPESLPGKKAVGALQRLDIEGKSITLKGQTIDGKPFDLARYRGKTVLVAFWGTTVPAAKRDLPEIAKIYDKNKAKGFEVVGICLDRDAQPVQDFLKADPLPWPTVFEPGGIEGRLGVEYGIITLPTMFLVDADGKVIKRNVRSAADLDIQLDKALAGNGNGVAARREP